jgi:Rv0078B-related antitoxin
MEGIAEAFRATLDLFQTGVDLMRQNLRRRHPSATDREIDQLLQRWLHERPGAEAGDCPGRRVDPRTRFA